MAKILLVEDDNNLREIYEARLAAEGFEIVAAQDGEQALVIAKQEHPDLIISDVMMPRISGFEMLDILRNTDELKYTKIIMLTALGQAEDQARADNLGADRYLVKSQVTLEDIVKNAKELLDDDAPAAATPAAEPTAEPAPPQTTESQPSETPVVAPTPPAVEPVTEVAEPVPAVVEPTPPITTVTPTAAPTEPVTPTQISPEVQPVSSTPISVLPSAEPATSEVTPEATAEPAESIVPPAPTEPTASVVTPDDSQASTTDDNDSPTAAVPTPPDPVPSPIQSQADSASPETPAAEPVPQAPAYAEPEATSSPIIDQTEESTEPIVEPAVPAPYNPGVAATDQAAATDEVASTATQTLEAEEAAMQAQINDFSAKPEEVSPTTTDEPDEEADSTSQADAAANQASNNQVMNEAVDQLAASTKQPEAQTVIPPTTPTPDNSFVPTDTGVQTAQPSSPATQISGDQATVANHKSLQPIDSASDKPSLSELLAKEAASQTPEATSPVVGGTATPSQPQPQVSPNKPAEPGFDPSSIAL
ncbi:MAG: response regulator [Candidatus Saccharimonadales bacterium]